ncbi:GAF domain-containing protein [Desulfonatronum thiosulfatophilum]|uniref:GAF domain-containing protein n=1 Tax=Desulfonatronum thiosulfatophilum TaxID=617002 RepID=A0A1G6B1Z5_9BACT|nr:GAF domain-containing protein [Desulfonatronum thiosulfatophilum]SDB14678.1 GAF domain-containing protein [Desulfonatronum thiosulfatophilum]
MTKEKDYYHSLYEVAKVINSSLDPSLVLDAITQQVTKALDLKACSIRLLADDGKNLLMGASHGLSKGYLRKGAVEVAKSGLDQEALSGKQVTIREACSDPRFQYPEKAKEEGISSVVVLPLLAEEKAIGVLRGYSEQCRDFSEEEIEFLTIIANLSAIAIENARLHHRLKLDSELQTAYDYRLFDD